MFTESARILVTGAAGFIGAHLVRRLLEEYPYVTVAGVDSLCDYYDVNLKLYRLSSLSSIDSKRWSFMKCDISDKEAVNSIFESFHPQIVVNLAAQAGVRYSVLNPDSYIKSNIIGFYNILEAARHASVKVEHLVYASSSSVYGNSCTVPYSADDRTDSPESLYAATKKSGELMASAYHKLYGIRCTGLRFFTVYGPAGRPDMACYSFTDDLVKGNTIRLFNYGDCQRDFTYVDDIIEGVTRVMDVGNMSGRVNSSGCAIYNIGGGNPVRLMDFVSTLAGCLVSEGLLKSDFNLADHIELVPMQPGDVVFTCADSSPLERDFGFRPRITVKEGVSRFVRWYKSYHGCGV